jgi:MFS family permease
MLVFEDFLRRFGVPDESAATGYSIPATRSSILVSLMSIGSLLGALSGAYTSDWWGRRKSLTFGVFLFIIGNVIQITSMESWIHMMMGRFVAGIGVGNLSVGELHPCCFRLQHEKGLSSDLLPQEFPCSNPSAVPARSEAPSSPPTNS